MSYSANNNQNIFVQSGRTTSRVLAPPGGHTSICIGGYQEPVHKKTTAATKTEPEASVKKENVEKQANTVKQLPVTKHVDQPISINAYAKSGTNVITGRSSSRVLQPPGGHSSIVLG